MNYNIKYNDKNLSVNVDEKKNIWVNNNIFQFTYNNKNIDVIIDNNSEFWFNLKIVAKILKYDIKNIEKKYITKHYEFSDKTYFISKIGLFDIIEKSNFNEKKKFIELLNTEVIPTLLKNKSFLYSSENLIKTTKKINELHFNKLIE